MSETLIDIGRGLSISVRELVENFVRATGPGGQNVNKVATAVELRFDLKASGLPYAVKRRAAGIAGQRLTKDGVIVLRAERFRTQELNRADARARLLDLLKTAAIPPKYRVATKPSRAAKVRRVEAKTGRGKVKALRRRPGKDD